MSDSEPKMKYLVTGVAGFIANRVADQLLSEGHVVVGIDNLNDYYNVSLKKWRLEQLQDKAGFQFAEGNIENLSALQGLFDQTKFDAVINLAARAGVRYSMENPHIYFSTNSQGNLNLLELCRKHDVPKYVLASTSSLYAGQPMPFSEELPVNEPISPYAASKKSAEVTAFTYNHLFDIDVSIVRYFTVYGPAARPDMSVFRFIHWIDNGIPIKMFGDGEQSRDFTFVDDIAAGTVAALKPVGYEIINLGGGNQPTSMNSLIGVIESYLGKKAIVNRLPAHPADMKVTWANIEKAERLLGWSPKISLDEGVHQSVEWYKSNLPWAATILDKLV